MSEYTEGILTSFLLFEYLFGNWFQVGNASLSVVDMVLTHDMQLVVHHIRELDPASTANNLFLWLLLLLTHYVYLIYY